MKRVLVPLAEGFEEMEGIIVVDVLRRAGVQVTTASLQPGEVRAARGTRHLADALLSEVADAQYDMVVLPGGAEGARNLEADPVLTKLLQKMKAGGLPIAAICAAPNVLRNLQLLEEGDRFTLHPATLDSGRGATYVANERVVRSGQFTTSVGPGSAFEFALDLVEQLCGPSKRDAVAAPLHLPTPS